MKKREIENEYTPQQRKALHLYCEKLAEALNDAGLDMRQTLKPGVDIPWSKDLIKKFMWKPILKAVAGIESTEKQNSKDPQTVYEILNRHTAAKLGVSVPWPCKEELINQQRVEDG